MKHLDHPLEGPVTAADALAAPAADTSPPAPLDPPGEAFWTEVTTALDLDGHEQLLLLETCRTLDLLAMLDRIVRDEGPLVKTRAGTRPHHAAVEARAQRVVLARLLASMRLPDGWSDPTPPARIGAPLQRPQRRGSARPTKAVGPRARNGPL